MFTRSLLLVGLIFFILSLAILAFIFLLPQQLWSSAAVILTPLNSPKSGGGGPCDGLVTAQSLVIDKYWPDQLNLNTSDTIRVLLVKRGSAGLLSIATTTTGNHKAAEEKLQFNMNFGTEIPSCSFDIDLPSALGSNNDLFAAAHLVATTFNIQSIGPEEKPFDVVNGAEWDWNISPKTLGTQLVNIDIDLLWKSKSNGQVVKQVQIWQSQFFIKVVQPFFDSSQLTAGALATFLLGLSSIFASIIAWGLAQISKRADEKKEGKTKEASQNADGTGERSPPLSASPSNFSPSPSDSQTMMVTHAPDVHRESFSTSAVSPTTRFDELSQKAKAYYADLQVYSREQAPAEWAATQNNLGVTLVAQARLAEGLERHILFTQAVTAYRSALQVHTPEGESTQWAIEQSNLGNALSALAQLARGSEQHELLTQAATAYQSALHIYTSEQTSTQWARVRMYLARVLLMKASLEHDTASKCALLQEASQSVEDVLSFFGQEGNTLISQQATQLYRNVQEQIQAFACHRAVESEG